MVFFIKGLADRQFLPIYHVVMTYISIMSYEQGYRRGICLILLIGVALLKHNWL